MKTSELIGPALDWAVAKCENVSVGKVPQEPHGFLETAWHPVTKWEDAGEIYTPSTNWAQGGPIIDSIKGFEFKQWLEAKAGTCCEARIHNYDGDWIQFGPTPLIAAMRCYVTSKLGDKIEIPEELL